MKVEIIETLSKIVEIDTNDYQDAILEAKRKYYDEEIVLNEDCLVDVEINLYLTNESED